MPDSLNESSVRPNPTLVFSKLLVRTGGSLIVRAGAREANRQDGRELNRPGRYSNSENVKFNYLNYSRDYSYSINYAAK